MFVKHCRVEIAHLWTRGKEFGHKTHWKKWFMKDVLSVHVSVLCKNITFHFLSFIGINIICLKDKHNCFFPILMVTPTSCYWHKQCVKSNTSTEKKVSPFHKGLHSHYKIENNLWNTATIYFAENCKILFSPPTKWWNKRLIMRPLLLFLILIIFGFVITTAAATTI